MTVQIAGEVRETGRIPLVGAGSVPSSAGGIGHLFARFNSIDEMRACGPLPEDAQRQIDERVVRVALNRLVVVRNLMEAGLVFPLDDPIGTPELIWDQISQMNDAKRAMIPGHGERQLPDRPRITLPIYCTYATNSIDIRTLRASQKSGAPLDLEFISTMTRSVNERIEDAAINGALVTVKGNTTPGLINAPSVGTFVYAGGEAWDAAGKTGAEILEDVLGMIKVLQGVFYFGPYHLWIPTLYGVALANQYTADFPRTIRSMLEDIDVGGGKLTISVADQLPADRTVMAQMTSDVVDIVDGQQPTAFSWTSPDGWNVFITVLAFEVPRTRDTITGQSGIVTGFTS
jgi:hypothetical protein